MLVSAALIKNIFFFFIIKKRQMYLVQHARNISFMGLFENKWVDIV